MADWAKLHADWKKERDKYVKKGAVSGVSIGGSIDAVEKASAKGYTALSTALNDMDAAVTKYRSKIVKDHPDLAKWMTKHLTEAVSAHRTLVTLDLNNLKWSIDNLMAGSSINILTILPEDGMMSNVMALVNDKKAPITFPEAVMQVQMFTNLKAQAPLLIKRASTLKAMKWSARLTGHDSDYAELEIFADIIISDVKLCVKWEKAADLTEWGAYFKEMKGKQTALDGLPHVQKACKSLMK